MPTVSFIIPVRNDAARLRRCLESIRADIAGVSAEIIVADNGSTDESAATAEAHGATVVGLPDRPVSEVRNTAARIATGELLAFVDADHTLAPGWTEAATVLFDNPATWAAGADYHAPVDGTWVQRMYDNLRSRAPEPRTAEWLPSGNFAVRRAAFERVGGFDTGLESCEDVDLSRRLREAGGRLVTSDALRSVHHGDPRSLRALFLAELWRGRDNLRVTLRDRLSAKAVLGMGLTVAQLAALAALLGGIVTIAVGGSSVAVAGAATLIVQATARMLRLLTRIPREQRRFRHAAQAFLVGAVYDSARALALIVRVGHDVRRKAGR